MTMTLKVDHHLQVYFLFPSLLSNHTQRLRVEWVTPPAPPKAFQDSYGPDYCPENCSWVKTIVGWYKENFLKRVVCLLNWHHRYALNLKLYKASLWYAKHYLTVGRKEYCSSQNFDWKIVLLCTTSTIKYAKFRSIIVWSKFYTRLLYWKKL